MYKQVTCSRNNCTIKKHCLPQSSPDITHCTAHSHATQQHWHTNTPSYGRPIRMLQRTRLTNQRVPCSYTDMPAWRTLNLPGQSHARYTHGQPTITNLHFNYLSTLFGTVFCYETVTIWTNLSTNAKRIQEEVGTQLQDKLSPNVMVAARVTRWLNTSKCAQCELYTTRQTKLNYCLI